MSSTSSSNYRRNKAEIEKYRKELRSMFEDIEDIDIKVLNKSVNEGLRIAKENTPVSAGGNIVDFTTKSGVHVNFTTKTSRVGGFMRKAWRSAPAVKAKAGGVTKSIVNTADYSEYVNYGHRIIQGGKIKGWVKGQFILEKSISHIEKVMKREFQKEVERVKRKHDK